MPKPIVCLSTALSQFAKMFRPCFSPHQWKYWVIVLLGLIECDGRRTWRGLLGVVGEQVSRAIKLEGGVAIAQAPETARYDGMPLSAIKTGLVDMVLAPEKIAEQLILKVSNSPM